MAASSRQLAPLLISRRHLTIGAVCAVAAAAGAAAKPRREVSHLAGKSLADIVPPAFGSWRAQDIADPLALKTEATLSSRLYAQQLARLYRHAETGDEIVLMIAYGARQTNELQLHRPEVCYPAFGFTLSRNEVTQIGLPQGVVVPARQMLAAAADRIESVLYWSRLGEFLPTSGSAQRLDRVRIALRGVVPDGLLARLSTESSLDPAPSWNLIRSFAASLVLAVAPTHRGALIGLERARRLNTVAPR